MKMKAKLVKESLSSLLSDPIYIEIKKYIEDDTDIEDLEGPLEDEDFLIYCAQDGKTRFVRYLIKKGLTKHKDLALYYAAQGGHSNAVYLLLEAGANATGEVLIQAIDGNIEEDEKSIKEVVELLLEYGANVHEENDQALRMAVMLNYLSVVKLLLNHGADVTALNNNDFLDQSLLGNKKRLMDNESIRFINKIKKNKST